MALKGTVFISTMALTRTGKPARHISERLQRRDPPSGKYTRTSVNTKAQGHPRRKLYRKRKLVIDDDAHRSKKPRVNSSNDRSTRGNGRRSAIQQIKDARDGLLLLTLRCPATADWRKLLRQQRRGNGGRKNDC